MTELAKKSFAAVPAVFVFSVIQQIFPADDVLIPAQCSEQEGRSKEWPS